jgi:hypothetical protein
VILTSNLPFLCTNTLIHILCASIKISGKKKKKKKKKSKKKKRTWGKKHYNGRKGRKKKKKSHNFSSWKSRLLFSQSYTIPAIAGVERTDTRPWPALEKNKHKDPHENAKKTTCVKCIISVK